MQENMNLIPACKIQSILIGCMKKIIGQGLPPNIHF